MRRLFPVLFLCSAATVAASPTHVALVESDEDSGNTTTHTITYPSGSYTSGDLIITCIGMDGSGSDLDLTWNNSATPFVEDGDDSTPVAWTECAWLESDGTDLSATTFTVSSNESQRSASVTWLITANADPDVTPPAVAHAGGNSATPDFPSLSPSGGSNEYYWLIFVSINNGPNPTDDTPSDYDNWGEFNGEGANVSIVYAADTLTQATLDPDAAAATSNSWSAITLAVYPTTTAMALRRGRGQ